MTIPQKKPFVPPSSKIQIPPKPAINEKFSRPQFKKKLKEGWQGAKFPTQTRVGLEKELFPWSRFGNTITDKAVRERLRELRKQETYTSDWKKKKEIKNQRATIEKATGIKNY